ncbi:hypothetical protein [Actinoplanes sp. NPDC026619]|uniref:hypothetical protein n=1 Tax=Actinoplanes sp. NPDC026619 TaxID=3155798 RepID=UPI0033FB1568
MSRSPAVSVVFVLPRRWRPHPARPACRGSPRRARGEPHKFDELGWFDPAELPSPAHSQLPETVALFVERQ